MKGVTPLLTLPADLSAMIELIEFIATLRFAAIERNAI